MAKSLSDTNSELAFFYEKIYNRAVELYQGEDYIPWMSEVHMHDSLQALSQCQEAEVSRIAFEMGRMYERLGVVV